MESTGFFGLSLRINKIHIDWRGRPVVVGSGNEQFTSVDG